ncbi:MAG: hypothetical protein CSA68_01620 [Rhodobacterales bacterium]|nr:MAG: hypothetical protein CSA68_01620 [Rhodobacterales bacterium]
MTFENLGHSALDYFPCRYGKSKILFRGPRKKMAGDFVAMLGGTDTYGKYIETPFPALVEKQLGVECVNFGCVNAGVDVFANDLSIIDACDKARVTVIQVVGAHNMSNRFYAVHPRRNDRFVRASTLLKTVFREVDFTDFHFTKHLLTTLHDLSPERFKVVQDELQEAWVARMKLLLDKIRSKTVLFWFADHAPDQNAPNGLGHDPLFVNDAMIEAVRPFVTEVVKVVPSAQARAQGTAGMLFPEMEEPAAEALMGPAAHAEAAEALAQTVHAML